MNENARALYEDLKAARLPQFDMRDVDDECGVPHCILGHALSRMGMLQSYRLNGELLTVRAKAYAWLGVDSFGNELCFPEGREVWGDTNPWKATQSEAAEALKRACELSEGNSHETD